MKVYVDELPKSCFECPCFGNNIDFLCGLSDGTKDYYLDEIDGGECPLQSLAEHDKQVRKEVAEEIRALAIKRNNDQFYIMIDEILDKIGEKKC